MKTSAFSAAALAAGRSFAAPADRKVPMSVQLYSVRGDCAKDFDGTLAALAASVLMVLVHRAARTPGQPLRPIPLLSALLVVAGAASCGAWGETTRQLALTRLGETDGPERI